MRKRKSKYLDTYEFKPNRYYKESWCSGIYYIYKTTDTHLYELGHSYHKVFFKRNPFCFSTIKYWEAALHKYSITKIEEMSETDVLLELI